MRNCGVESLFCGRACCSGVLHYLGRHCTAKLPVQCCAIWCIGAVSSALLRRDETGDTFAGPSECWLETGVAFARVGRASTETAIAFAGEKWVFLVRFSVALVMVVSAGAVQGRAVVIVKSRVLCRVF